MSINITAIENKLYDRVYKFTHESIYELVKRKNISREDIKILMPEWLFSFFNYQVRVEARFLNVPSRHFLGVDILPHYQNEVVVYYEKYSVNNDGCYFTLSIDEFLNTKELTAK